MLKSSVNQLTVFILCVQIILFHEMLKLIFLAVAFARPTVIIFLSSRKKKSLKYSQDSKVLFYSSEFTFNPKMIESMDFVIFNNSKPDSFYNLTFALKRDLSKVVLCFDLNTKAEALVEEYNWQVFRANIDICKIEKGTQLLNYVVEHLAKLIEHYANFRLECPLKHGNYSIHNFPAPQDKPLFISSIFFNRYIPWEMTITVRMKETIRSTAYRGFQIKVRGETVRV